MSKTLELLEAKLKRHNWNWSNAHDPDEFQKGKNNFDDIERLVKQAAAEGIGGDAYRLMGKYRK